VHHAAVQHREDRAQVLETRRCDLERIAVQYHEVGEEAGRDSRASATGESGTT
jgi:hypothetical protein